VPHFSALTWRILAFNALALIVFTGGVILVQASGRGLVEERLNSIQEQANIVAGTIAQYATDPDRHVLKTDEAEPLLRELIAPTRLRGRLYVPDGHLAIDTRYLLPRNAVQSDELPPLNARSQVQEWIKRLHDGLVGVRPFTKLEPYYESGSDGRVYREVTSALTGQAASGERVDDRNRLVLSVAVPIQRFTAIYGVLLLSTEGGDIDDILQAERAQLIEVFAVACLSTKYRLLAWHVVSRGTRASTPVSMPDVFVPACLTPGTTGLMVVHNHPSGSLDPSRDDVEFTRTMARAGELMGINLYDYLVVPRVAGVMVATLALTFYIQFLAVAGGLLLSPFIIEATFMELASRLFDLFAPVDFYYSIIKALLFGFAVAACCCYHGLNPPDLTQNAVPKVVTRAVTQAAMLVLTINAVFAYLVFGILFFGLVKAQV